MLKLTSLLVLLSLPLLAAGATSGTGQTAPGKIRNLLLIMSDDLKASALPAYGDVVCCAAHGVCLLHVSETADCDSHGKWRAHRE